MDDGDGGPCGQLNRLLAQVIDRRWFLHTEEVGRQMARSSIKIMPSVGRLT